MHTAIYVICFLFYTKLKHLDYHSGVARHRSEKFFAELYGFAVFITLLITDSEAVFFGFGRYGVQNIGVENTFDINAGEALFIAAVLTFVFFFTVRLGGLLFAGRVWPTTLLFFIPGLFINAIVASILITTLGW